VKNSAIILAGGSSSRFGQDKVLIRLGGRALIHYVIEAVEDVVDEVILVVNNLEKRKRLNQDLNLDIKIVIDELDSNSSLVGALTGFRNAKGEYSLLMPCDTPFISKLIISLLFNSCVGVNAVIPKWPNGFIEPLQAVYRTDKAVEAIERTLSSNKFDYRSFISNLRDTKYIPIATLRKIDPELMTFMNINTLDDLRTAEIRLKESSFKEK
jgi:molybdopterin-guanine dinucleotide biosynthesis protein A